MNARLHESPHCTFYNIFDGLFFFFFISFCVCLFCFFRENELFGNLCCTASWQNHTVGKVSLGILGHNTPVSEYCRTNLVQFWPHVQCSEQCIWMRYAIRMVGGGACVETARARAAGSKGCAGNSWFSHLDNTSGYCSAAQRSVSPLTTLSAIRCPLSAAICHVWSIPCECRVYGFRPPLPPPPAKHTTHPTTRNTISRGVF